MTKTRSRRPRSSTRGSASTPRAGFEGQAPANPPVVLSHLAHRQVIGYLGLLLPAILLYLARIRETDGIDRVVLDSVSAYYYTGGVAAFVGTLVALALFLITYRGYQDDRADRVVGFIGGLGALGVAFFPTTAPLQAARLAWWSENTRTIHYASAGILFVMFILFSLWLFPRSSQDPESMTPAKRARNRIYYTCGIVMLVSVLWCLFSLKTRGPIVIPEVLAFVAFAISWLTKGEAEVPWVDTAKWVVGKR
jgi:hypothetical protein